MTSTVVLGIDAGGSKTLALAAALDGRIVGRGESGPANYQSIGQSAAFLALNAAASQAVESADLTVEAVTAICLGAAGMDRPEDFAVFQRWAALAFPGARIHLVNDARIVLAAGTPQGWGLALISGTGSIAYGRSESGETARSGGWGYLLGDEGSGYDIGLRALHAVTQSADGRAAPTLLTGAVLQSWGLTRPQELVRKVYSGMTRAEIARLARVVEQCALQGDAAAAAILDQAGAELAAAAAAVVRKLGLASPVPSALTGGVLVGGEHVRSALLRASGGLGLALEPAVLVAEPARGAVRLALEILDPRC